MTDRLIRITTALAVAAVALVAAVISYQHAYKLVRSHGESGVTARLVPFTVDGLIWAALWWYWPPAGTTAGRMEPGRRDLRHGRRQPGAWGGAWSGRCAGQRLARTGAGRLLRATDDAHPHWTKSTGRSNYGRTSVRVRSAAGARCTSGPAGCASPGADHPRPLRSRSQPARHRPRTQP